MGSYFVYILKCSDNSLYTGITTDLIRRVDEHNGSIKGAKYTAAHQPVTLVYAADFINRSLATIEESRIKKLTRLQKLKLIVTQKP